LRRRRRRDREFSTTSKIPWRRVGEGVSEKILSRDSESGAYIRLLHFDPGAETFEVFTHDFYEEVYILEGSLTDKRLKRTFRQGMFAFRNPEMKHGPYSSADGCTTIEFRHFGLKRKEV